jgi:hypothetical protein
MNAGPGRLAGATAEFLRRPSSLLPPALAVDEVVPSTSPDS